MLKITPLILTCKFSFSQYLAHRNRSDFCDCDAHSWARLKHCKRQHLRVAVLSDFSARRLSQNFGAKLKQKSAQVRAVFLGNLLAQNSHLQCYRLLCFSFAQQKTGIRCNEHGVIFLSSIMCLTPLEWLGIAWDCLGWLSKP